MRYVSIPVKVADKAGLESVAKRFGTAVPSTLDSPFGTIKVEAVKEGGYILAVPCLYVDEGDDLALVDARLSRDLGSISFRETATDGETATVEEPATLFTVANHGGLRLCYNKAARDLFVGSTGSGGFTKLLPDAMTWLTTEVPADMIPTLGATIRADKGRALVEAYRKAKRL